MQRDLVGFCQMIGSVAAIRAPYTGKTLELRAEETAKAVTKVASTNDAVFKFLERFLYVNDWVEVGRVAGSLATAVAIDVGAANQNTPTAFLIGGAANYLIPDVVKEVAEERAYLESLTNHEQEAA